MKISELITKLQAVQAEHGDVHVGLNETTEPTLKYYAESVFRDNEPELLIT